MAEPATGGRLCTSIAEMKVGDYIQAYTAFNSGYSPVLSIDKNINYEEMPVSGLSTTNGSGRIFYMIKVDTGLLVSDRVIYHSISWDKLNSFKLIQGWSTKTSAYTGGLPEATWRSLGGGNSYATADGKSSTSDTGNGAWPTDNEWDEYIVRKDYGGDGPGADTIWHWSGIGTWTQDTALIINDGIRRSIRGDRSAVDFSYVARSSNAHTSFGFRPVFEYQEGDLS